MKKVLIKIVELVKVRLPQGVMLGRASLDFRKDCCAHNRQKPSLSLENNFHFLLEGGGRILLEKDGTKAFPPSPKQPTNAVCLEDGKHILLEDGNTLKLEN